MPDEPLGSSSDHRLGSGVVETDWPAKRGNVCWDGGLRRNVTTQKRAPANTAAIFYSIQTNCQQGAGAAISCYGNFPDQGGPPTSSPKDLPKTSMTSPNPLAHFPGPAPGIVDWTGLKNEKKGGRRH